MRFRCCCFRPLQTVAYKRTLATKRGCTHRTHVTQDIFFILGPCEQLRTKRYGQQKELHTQDICNTADFFFGSCAQVVCESICMAESHFPIKFIFSTSNDARGCSRASSNIVQGCFRAYSLGTSTDNSPPLVFVDEKYDQGWNFPKHGDAYLIQCDYAPNAHVGQCCSLCLWVHSPEPYRPRININNKNKKYKICKIEKTHVCPRPRPAHAVHVRSSGRSAGQPRFPVPTAPGVHALAWPPSARPRRQWQLRSEATLTQPRARRGQVCLPSSVAGIEPAVETGDIGRTAVRLEVDRPTYVALQ